MQRGKWLLGTLILLALAPACASRPAMTPQQAMAQAEVGKKEKDLNQLLLAQGAQAALGSRDYRVGAEDLLEVQVYGQDDLHRLVRVNGKGEISMPLIGPVKVAGLSPQQVEERLVELYGTQYLKNPQVTVFVKEYRHERVAVTGALKTPGFYEMIGPRTLLEMLAMAGGLDERAGDLVYVIRPQKPAREAPEAKAAAAARPFDPNTETIAIDLRRILKTGSGQGNIAIKPGDVINVPFAGNAFVLGSVNRPGNVAVKKDLTVTQAVAMAGGTTAGLAKPSATSILRLDENGQSMTIPANLDQIIAKKEPDIPIKENDVIFVPESGVRRFLMDVRQLLGTGMSVGYSVAP